MGLAVVRALAVTIALLAVTQAAAAAPELVEIPEGSIRLKSYLYRPAGDGPFPAVVSLHGCAGRSSPEAEEASGARYVERGYVLLIVDSFGPRGIIDRCLGEEGAAIDRTMDAYGALLYLAGSPFIDSERIAVIGFSQGAGAALAAVALGGVETLFEHHF